jgi:hypothetical protein
LKAEQEEDAANLKVAESEEGKEEEKEEVNLEMPKLPPRQKGVAHAHNQIVICLHDHNSF